MRAVLGALATGWFLSAGLAIAPVGAQPADTSNTLMPGKGAALTMAKCAICHEIKHVTRTRLSRDEWADNIKVMIDRGMPIEAHEIPIVLDYLATYYNRDAPPPPPDPTADAQPAAGGAIERTVAERGCTACHATDKRIVGPSFHEIAQKYKGDAGAPGRLAARIRDGGAGAWGAVPMPPHPQIGEEELARIVGWVLNPK